MKNHAYPGHKVRIKMTNKSSVLKIILASIFLLSIAGCIIIPTDFHTADSRTNISRTVEQLIVIGETTKEDILLTLGEPDKISLDEKCLAYSWSKVKAIWVVGGGYQAATGGIGQDYHIVLSFDKNDYIFGYEFIDEPIFWGEGEHYNSDHLCITSIECGSAPVDLSQVKHGLLDLTVSMPVVKEFDPKDLLADITMIDKRERRDISGYRTSIFGLMGIISFTPSETEIIKKFLTDELTSLQKIKGINSKKSYKCELVEFLFYTERTPTYWNLIGKIELSIIYEKNEKKLVANYIKKTVVLPGESAVKQVLQGCLNKIRYYLITQSDLI